MTSPTSLRWVNLSPERLPAWLATFTQRHGEPETELTAERLLLRCPDRAEAHFQLGWGPLPGASDPLAELVEIMLLPRRVAALIVHKRAHAVGVFFGASLLHGRHHRHYVQGRTKAGGWSQQRYARRRANQTGRAYAAAIQDAVELLASDPELDALATGGDQAGVETVLSDQRLGHLNKLPRLRVAAIGDPNATVLAGFGDRLRRVSIGLNEHA